MSARRSVQAEQSPTITLVEDSTLLSNSMPVESVAVTDAVAQLLESIKSSSPAANLDLVTRAANFAIAAHGADVRKSGEPYVIHPIAVATILARIQLDSETIAARAAPRRHRRHAQSRWRRSAVEFGPRVALLVDGVTKLGRIPWTADDVEGAGSREKAHQAENLRKMFLAMVDDIGVVLIKLADRLHNMRTLEALPPDKQLRIAQQTLEIYAPLANRLGIWQFKSELEDLAFRYINPTGLRRAARGVRKARPRHGAIHRAGQRRNCRRRLRDAGIEAEITGRTKHIYSIYRKMPSKGRSIDEIYDVIGLRVLVNDRQDCYGALGVVHARWHPLPGEFDDYIATPKDSMYQSLHTAVVGPGGHPIEIQIRTARCTALPSTALPLTGATKKVGAPTPGSRPRWPGCASSWSGAIRLPMRRSSSNR